MTDEKMQTLIGFAKIVAKAAEMAEKEGVPGAAKIKEIVEIVGISNKVKEEIKDFVISKIDDFPDGGGVHHILVITSAVIMELLTATKEACKNPELSKKVDTAIINMQNDIREVSIFMGLAMKTFKKEEKEKPDETLH